MRTPLLSSILLGLLCWAASANAAPMEQKLLAYDFSSLLLPEDKEYTMIEGKAQFIGYYSDDYRKLSVRFLDITKDKHDPKRYHVKGLAHMHGSAERSIEGYIQIDSLPFTENPDEMDRGLDDEHVGKVAIQGTLHGYYHFKEQPDGSEDEFKTNIGEYWGRMSLRWVVDKKGILKTNDIEWYSDSFNNNIYDGKWSAYDGSNNYVANWSEMRFPFSRDLDNGAAEAYIDPKYKNKGLGWN